MQKTLIKVKDDFQPEKTNYLYLSDGGVALELFPPFDMKYRLPL